MTTKFVMPRFLEKFPRLQASFGISISSAYDANYV